uniref:Uncharacterized protein n=1 Tax=Globodera rostochiensis TaxID=31243 RepID=A0A914IE23_GLORO
MADGAKDTMPLEGEQIRGMANGWTKYDEPRRYTLGQLAAKSVEQMAGKAAENFVLGSAKGHGDNCRHA